MMRWWAITLVVAVALGTSALDDPPPEADVAATTFGDDVEVTVVNVEVFVRDRKGRPLEGLTVEDFRLTQDGVEMPISHFAFLGGAVKTGTVGAAGRGAAPLPGAAGPLGPRPVSILLFVDNVNLDALRRNRVLNRLRGFVDEVLQPPVQMMVVSAQPSLSVHQDFTGDAGAVAAALDRVAVESSGRLARDRDRKAILDLMEETSGDPRMDVREFLEDIPMQVLKTQVQAQIVAHVEQESDVLEDTLTTLHEALRLVAGREGRKALIHVSNGLPMVPGLGLLHEFEQVFRDTSIYTRIAQRDFTAEFRSLTRAASASDVAFYTLDASGLNPLEGFGADDRFVPEARASWVEAANLEESLEFMADETGGLAVLGTNDVAAGLGRIRDDLASYYSLGYTVSRRGDGAAHRIEVELPEHGRVDIRHRQWFVDKSPATLVRERVLTALIRDIDDNPMELALSVGEAAPGADRRLEVPLKVSIPLGRLSLVPDGADLVGSVEMVLGVRDGWGREAEPRRLRQVIRVSGGQAQSERDQRVAIVVPLLVRNRDHVVAVGVVDLGTGLASYARAVISLP